MEYKQKIEQLNAWDEFKVIKFKKNLTSIGYALHLLASIIWPLFALIAVHSYSLKMFIFLMNLCALTTIFAISISIMVKRRYLYVLNVFAITMFFCGFSQVVIKGSFIEIGYIVYALLAIGFFFMEFLTPDLTQKLCDDGRK